MTRCESYPLCSGTIYFPTAPFFAGSFLETCSNLQKVPAPV